MTNRQEFRQVLTHYGYFFLAWFIIQIFYNVPIKNLTGGWLEEGLLNVIKLTMWLGAGLILIACFRAKLAVERPFKPNWSFLPFYLWLIGLTGYLIFSALVRHHPLGLVASFQWRFVFQDFLIVGLCEETVFRGYFLNRLLRLMKSQQGALVLQALLFAAIHLPRYLTTYPSIAVNTMIINLVMVALLGYLFGWLFVRSHSLWPGIIVHSVWDLLVVALIG